MDLLLIAALVTVAALLLAALGLGRMAWRMWRHNEEMQPGGSLSHQMFGRTKDK